MTKPIILHLNSTTSTNQYLLDFVEGTALPTSEIPEFLTVVADYQTGGRGLGENRWFSEAGENILATLFFRPGLKASQQFAFNQFFAVSVRQLLLQYLPEVEIKWPNDIYVGGRKIAGILIQHAVRGENLRHTIAGIGININQSDFPPTLPNPVSLSQLTKNRYEIPKLTEEMLLFCQKNYPRLQDHDFESLNEDYLSCLYRKDRLAPYLIGEQKVTATIIGVDNFGRLLLKGENGQDFCCGMKEIVFL